jgi:biopolymer transport protein ExbD
MQVLETPRLSSEINVAPMIDVLLVLLVVFMLSMTAWRFIPVNVPPPHPAAGRPQEPPIVLDLQPDHQFAINGRVVPKAELGSRLAALYANQRRTLLFIRVAGTWRYGEMIEATDIARGAGVQVIGYMPSKQ